MHSDMVATSLTPGDTVGASAAAARSSVIGKPELRGGEVYQRVARQAKGRKPGPADDKVLVMECACRVNKLRDLKVDQSCR